MKTEWRKSVPGAVNAGCPMRFSNTYYHLIIILKKTWQKTHFTHIFPGFVAYAGHTVLVAKCLQSSAWLLNCSSIHSCILCKRVQKAWRPTCSLYEAWVGIVCDEGNRQLSEVEFEGSGDDVDVLISIRGNISLLSVCGANQSIHHPNKSTKR